MTVVYVPYSLDSGQAIVFKVHRHVYHSTLGLRVIKKKKKEVRQRASGHGARFMKARERDIQRENESERAEERERENPG